MKYGKKTDGLASVKFGGLNSNAGARRYMGDWMKPERELSASALYWRARQTILRVEGRKDACENLKWMTSKTLEIWLQIEVARLQSLARNRAKLGKSPPCNTGPSNASHIFLS